MESLLPGEDLNTDEMDHNPQSQWEQVLTVTPNRGLHPQPASKNHKQLRPMSRGKTPVSKPQIQDPWHAGKRVRPVNKSLNPPLWIGTHKSQKQHQNPTSHWLPLSLHYVHCKQGEIQGAQARPEKARRQFHQRNEKQRREHKIVPEGHVDRPC